VDCAATVAAKAIAPETRKVMRAKPKMDIGVIINGFGVGIACRSISRSSPHSIVGDIRGRPVSADYDVQTRDLTA
jgi:hypothetical protein